jgi:septal ring factor EnvC (AmiA/AmiB activator)
MLRYAFSFLFLLVFSTVFSQNKKQQLEALTARYDSLTAVLVTERATSTRSINALTTSVEQLTTQIESLTAEIARLNSDKRANQLKLNTATEQLALLTAQLMQKKRHHQATQSATKFETKITYIVGWHTPTISYFCLFWRQYTLGFLQRKWEMESRWFVDSRRHTRGI